MNDKECLQRLRQDDSEALEEAMDCYSGYVMAVLSKTLGVWGTAEDREELLSDAFVSLWRSRRKLRPDSNLKYWLAVVARNGAAQHLRRFHAEIPLTESELTQEETAVFDLLEREERSKLLHQAMEQLSEIDRDIFLRYYFWKQSIRLIATETHIKESTIKSKLARGRNKLKSLFVKEDCI